MSLGFVFHRRRFERLLATFSAVAVLMSMMVILAPAALAHHPILGVSAQCDDQGNKVVTWTVSNGNWEGRTMTVDLVQYTDGTEGWANVVVGLNLGPDASTTEIVTYPLEETGTKTLTVSGDWSDGGSQNVSTSLSINFNELKCDETTTTTTEATTTTTQATTTTTQATTTTTQATTTTTQATTTTTQATTTTTIVGIVPSTVPDVVGGITVTTSIPSIDSSVLPFTGVDRGQLIALGASALALGLLLVAGARREET